MHIFVVFLFTIFKCILMGNNFFLIINNNYFLKGVFLCIFSGAPTGAPLNLYMFFCEHFGKQTEIYQHIDLVRAYARTRELRTCVCART